MRLHLWSVPDIFFDSDAEQISYQEYIQDGNDPREHILYCAAVVLGETEDFQQDILDYQTYLSRN